LEAAFDYCREGDTLVVTKLDRLARSARHLSELVDKLEANGVALRILDFSGNAVDTRGATGRLMLNMFAAMAQFEREMMLERQRRASPKQRRKGSTRVGSPLLGRRLKMRFASLRRAKRPLTSRVSWESGVEASTAHLKARVKPVRA
jgi:DNA invertase Pin-like site-specific DNA recombinase